MIGGASFSAAQPAGASADEVLRRLRHLADVWESDDVVPLKAVNELYDFIDAAARPASSEPGSSAADVDGAERSLGHHESVGERQGRQPGSLGAEAAPAQAALDALKRYGSHDDRCKRYQHDWRVRFRDAEPTCLCGYSAALQAAERAAAVPADAQADAALIREARDHAERLLAHDGHKNPPKLAGWWYAEARQLAREVLAALPRAAE